MAIAIADEPENRSLTHATEALGCQWTFGDPLDVLGRLIEAGGATDIVRKTTESPFFELEGMQRVWEQHVRDGNDITVVDHVPLGTAVEIYTKDVLRRSHREGRDEDRRGGFPTSLGTTIGCFASAPSSRPHPADARTSGLRSTIRRISSLPRHLRALRAAGTP